MPTGHKKQKHLISDVAKWFLSFSFGAIYQSPNIPGIKDIFR